MRGGIVFDAGGQRYTLFLGNAAQCAVEEQYDRGFFAVVADAMPGIDPQVAMAVARAMQTGAELSPALAAKAQEGLRSIRLSVLRDLAWHGLREHHPDITLPQVSTIADELGRDAFSEIIGRALRAAQGEAEESGPAPALGKPKPPRSRKTRG
ncbi:hypothetical protein ACQR50_10495 [Sphingomonas sp. Xoc002]|uniref:hypothetical protein n=1 Tax=Sphingomonas sp. Xoc002 TaxID=2837624 RepID=UPI003D170FBE